MDGGATFHGVAELDTTERLHFHFQLFFLDMKIGSGFCLNLDFTGYL